MIDCILDVDVTFQLKLYYVQIFVYNKGRASSKSISKPIAASELWHQIQLRLQNVSFTLWGSCQSNLWLKMYKGLIRPPACISKILRNHILTLLFALLSGDEEQNWEKQVVAGIDFWWIDHSRELLTSTRLKMLRTLESHLQRFVNEIYLWLCSVILFLKCIAITRPSFGLENWEVSLRLRLWGQILSIHTLIAEILCYAVLYIICYFCLRSFFFFWLRKNLLALF